LFWLIAKFLSGNSNANSPKRPSQNDFGTAFVPTGQPDNSPAFQRRGACARPPRVPPGRLNGRHTVFILPIVSVLKTPVVPPGLGLPAGFNPALKCRAIVITSLCDGQTPIAPNVHRKMILARPSFSVFVFAATCRRPLCVVAFGLWPNWIEPEARLYI